MKYKKIVDNKNEIERLDKFIAFHYPALSRSYFKFLIDNKKVKVNGKFEKPAFIINSGDIIEWEDFKKERFLKTKENLNIIFENKDLIVIDKPAGLAVHPKESLKPRKEATLTDILINKIPELKEMKGKRPGIVHRLDKDTSGVLIVAKNEKTQTYLKEQFRDRKVKKTYKALLMGRLEPKEGAIDAYLGRDKRNRLKMAVTPEKEGRGAITEYKVIEYLPPNKDVYSLVEAYPKTGRTHQIRVHFASIGHPVVGDTLYGPKKPQAKIGRQFLHAYLLGIDLPDGQYREFKLNLPNDLQNFLDLLK